MVPKLVIDQKMESIKETSRKRFHWVHFKPHPNTVIFGRNSWNSWGRTDCSLTSFKATGSLASVAIHPPQILPWSTRNPVTMLQDVCFSRLITPRISAYFKYNWNIVTESVVTDCISHMSLWCHHMSPAWFLEDFLPSFFTPLLPYVLSEVAEDNVAWLQVKCNRNNRNNTNSKIQYDNAS